MPRPTVTTTKPRKLSRGFTWDATRRCVVWQPRHPVTGKRPKVRGVDEADCRAKWAAQLAAEGPAPEAAPAGSWADAYARWLPIRSHGKRPQTVNGYRDAAGAVLAALDGRFGSAPLASLTVGDAELVLAEWVIDRGYAPNTVRDYRAVAGNVCRFAVRHGLATSNPFDGAETPRPAVAWLDDDDEPAGGIRHLKADEFRTLRDVCRTGGRMIHAMAMTQLLTGMRPGEALGLRWSAVDFDAGVIHVRTALNAGDGKRTWFVGPLKNPQSRRTIELPAMLAAVLDEHRTRQREHYLRTGLRPADDLVFTTRFGRHMLPKNYNVGLTRLCEMAGVPDVAPNGLRHSAATYMLHNGVPHADVAAQLGHKNTRMVIEHYEHSGVRRGDVPTRGVLAS